jgi:uncharacterized membrane protein
VLRSFMRDRPTQMCLGVFLGIFAYCLVVLRTVRGGEENGFIPSLAALVAMAYALAGIAALIFFIHHVAQSIQAGTIIERIAADARTAIDHLFPQELGQAAQQPVQQEALPGAWTPVRARRSGYVTDVAGDPLLDWAGRHGRVLRITAGVGEFVGEGAILLEAGGTAALSEDEEGELLSCVHVGRVRTVEQDAAFGLQQLVDVALRALSPSLNDPTTACMCIDRLGALLARLSSRRMPERQRMQDGQVRVVAPVPDFERMVRQCFLPILYHSRGDLQVLQRVMAAVRMVAAKPLVASRRAALIALLRDVRLELRAVRPVGRAQAAMHDLRSLEREVRAGTAAPSARRSPARGA